VDRLARAGEVLVLAILTTHPIQYQVPLWRALASDGRVPFEVWYMSDHGMQPSYDSEFGTRFAWDIDMMSGYPHHFIGGDESPDSFWQFRLHERLRHRLAQAGATALWIQGWQVAAYWQAVREAQTVSVPVWMRAESNDLAPRTGWKAPLKRLLLGYLFGKVDRFLTIGSANRRLYESYGIAASRLRSAPYAVDNARFAQQAAALRPRRPSLRQAWGIADDAFCVLFCGKFIAKKRPLDLVAAARRLRGTAAPNLHLLFAGAGALKAEIRAACDAAGVTATFTGFLNQTEISRAYVAADCLALPSDHGETWGLVVNEALASGLPCVASDAAGCTEDLLRPIDPRLSYRLGDVADLADALLHVRTSPPSPAQIAGVVARHSFGATVEAVAALMQQRRAL
jgi:glycosyltransferase involved in cell wall biosynthesis